MKTIFVSENIKKINKNKFIIYFIKVSNIPSKNKISIIQLFKHSETLYFQILLCFLSVIFAAPAEQPTTNEPITIIRYEREDLPNNGWHFQ